MEGRIDLIQQGGGKRGVLRLEDLVQRMRIVQAVVRDILEEAERESAFIADILLEMQDAEGNVARDHDHFPLFAEAGFPFHFQQDFAAEQIHKGEQGQDRLRHVGDIEESGPFHFLDVEQMPGHVDLRIPIGFDC